MPQQLPFALGPRRSVEEVSRPQDADPENPTIDEILRSAKAAVGSSGRLLKDIETGAGLRGNTRFAAENPEFTTGQALAETGEAMLLPLAFAGGPVGIGAQALFGLQGLADIADPAAGGLQKVMGALSAIPGTKQARALAGKVAPGVSRFVSRLSGPAKAEAPVIGQFVPNLPAASTAADEGAAAFRGLQGPEVSRFTPNLPAASPVADEGAAALRGLQGPEISRFTPNLPAASTGASEEAQALKGLQSVVERFMPNKPALAGSVGAGEDIAQAVSPQVSAVSRASRLDAEPQAGAFREAARHGTAGFSQLPELSEQELARITALLSRFGG